MSVIDTAIARLQAIALQMSGIKAAPTYPTEDATALPLVIAHVTSGEILAQDATYTRGLHTVAVEIHVNRTSLKNAFTLLDGYCNEYGRRLAGDPTLAGAVDTIVFPVTYSVTPSGFDSIDTIAGVFNVTFKAMEAPIASS